MFSFKSLAVAAGIAFAAMSSVCATPATVTPTADVTTTTQTYTYTQEKSIVYVLEKTKYEVTPVVQKFRKSYHFLFVVSPAHNEFRLHHEG